MVTPDDLQNLSKEELLALLKSTRQQLAVSVKEAKSYKKKAVSFERKSDKYELKFRESQQELKKSEQKYKKLQHEHEVAIMLTTEHIHLMAEMTREANCRVVDADEVLAKAFIRQLEFIFEEGREWIQNAVTWRSQSYATGNDVKNEKIADSEKSEQSNKDDKKNKDEAQTPKTDAELLAELQKDLAKTESAVTKRAVTTLKNKLIDTVKKTPKGLIAHCPDELQAICNTPVPEPEESKPKKSKGRQKKDLEPATVAKGEAPSDNKCPDCGGKLEESGEFSKDFGTSLRQELGRYTEYVRIFCSLKVCYHCRKVHCFFDENTDLPIKPNRCLGLKLFLEACDNISMGHPLNHLAFFVNMELKFGNSTFIDNFIDGVMIYLMPWFGHYFDKAKNARYLLADGTPFPCLETQGRGCCQLKKDKDGNAEAAEPSTSNYILSLCNGPLAEEQFSCYDFLRTRSAKSIKEILTDDFKFTTLICDAFGGYDTIVKERNCFMQNCLVHLRRYIVNDLKPDDYAKELLKLSDEELQQFLQTQLKEGSDRLLLFSVYIAISKIYALEDSVDFKATDAKEQILKVRESEKILMTSLEKIMESLCSRHLIISDDGKGVKKKRGDPLSRCCYYWYKRRAHFTLFLDDPMIPPDTNMVEQIIRPLTIIRKNSNFMNTELGMKCLCIIYTVWASLKKNGINNPAAFLEPYCRDVFTYCVSKNYTHYFFDQHDEDPAKLNKKLNTWNMQSLYEDFDFQKYFDLAKQS